MKRIWIMLVLAVLATSLLAISCDNGGEGGGKKTSMKKSSGDEDGGGDATSDS
jgi:hypothetical protein